MTKIKSFADLKAVATESLDNRVQKILSFTLEEMNAMDYDAEVANMSDQQKDAVLEHWIKLEREAKEARRNERISSTMSCLLKAGDEVVMQMDEDARQWGRKGPADGTKGIVTGHHRYINYRHRFGIDTFLHTPGVYESNGAPLVQWEGEDAPVTVSEHDIYMVDQEEAERRYQDLWVTPVHKDKTISTTQQKDMLNNTVRLSDLPEPEFYEMDLVEFIDDPFQKRDNGNRPIELRVLKISYNFEYADGTRGNHFDVAWFYADTGEYANAGSTSGTAEQIRLVERGNVWKYYNGKQSEMRFRSLIEESNFHADLGKVDDVRNPKSGRYSWTLDEALEAIRNGTADGFTNGFVPLTDRRSISVKRFHDRDIGERVRQTTVAGFAN